jgi:Rps23 Pro-64 3,4-dihydroxylase Tpa1-like proline 4-hydroxylase
MKKISFKKNIIMDSRFQPKFKYTWNDPKFLTNYIHLPSPPPPKKINIPEIKSLPPPPPTPQQKTETDLDESHNTVFQFVSIHNNLLDYQQEFLTTRKVKIDRVLNEKFAESLYLHLLRMPENQFYTACGIRNIKYKNKNIPNFIKKNQENVNEANRTFGRGEFSYHFHRGMNNNAGEITSFETILRTILNSTLMKDLLSKITGLEITQLSTMFLSRYRSGHFLSPHSDKGNGKIAFVINLTKNWLPQYGGNLHFLSEDRTKIIETWTPAFNNMVIFNVPPEEEKDCGMPHFVGHVAPNVKYSRYAITGWYS